MDRTASILRPWGASFVGVLVLLCMALPAEVAVAASSTPLLQPDAPPMGAVVAPAPDAPAAEAPAAGGRPWPTGAPPDTARRKREGRASRSEEATEVGGRPDPRCDNVATGIEAPASGARVRSASGTPSGRLRRLPLRPGRTGRGRRDRPGRARARRPPPRGRDPRRRVPDAGRRPGGAGAMR